MELAHLVNHERKYISRPLLAGQQIPDQSLYFIVREEGFCDEFLVLILGIEVGLDVELLDAVVLREPPAVVVGYLYLDFPNIGPDAVKLRDYTHALEPISLMGMRSSCSIKDSASNALR